MIVTSPAESCGEVSPRMSAATADHDNPALGEVLPPTCQWSFTRAHQFHHVSGDSESIFGRHPVELLRRSVSEVDDSQGNWSARLGRLLSGEARIEQSSAARSGSEYILIHFPLRDPNGAVAYIAGFAFRAGSTLPALKELELAALAALQAVEAERTRATRFLHDVVAQSLSGTGLQLELLNSELWATDEELWKRAATVQQILEKVLTLVRAFNAPA